MRVLVWVSSVIVVVSVGLVFCVGVNLCRFR